MILGRVVISFGQILLIIGKVKSRNIKAVQGWEGVCCQTGWNLDDMRYKPVRIVKCKDRTMRKKMKTPRRKRVENREEAYEIMVEGRKVIDIASRDVPLRLLDLDSQRFLLLLDVGPSHVGTNHGSSRIRQ